MKRGQGLTIILCVHLLTTANAHTLVIESTHEYMDLVFMSTIDNQSMSIGCVSKLRHRFDFLRHYSGTLIIGPPLGLPKTGQIGEMVTLSRWSECMLPLAAGQCKKSQTGRSKSGPINKVVRFIVRVVTFKGSTVPLKGTSRGPEALQSHLNNSSHTNVLCWPEQAMTSEIVCFHRYWNSASQTPRCPLNAFPKV